MNDIFAYDSSYYEPALFLSPAHLGILLFFVLFLILYYRWRATPFVQRYGRWIILAILLVSELSLLLWTLLATTWDVRYHLPFQLCTISLYVCILMLFQRSRSLFEIVYFFGLAGALQAILTPDLFYTFPHYRFLHFFIAHFAIITAILHMVWVERFTIKAVAILKSFLVLNGFALIAFLVNLWTGANYMFLARKPVNGSILDFLAPYPWYILQLEVIALLMFGLLYLPFLKKRG
ncbi:TIGR02206 family membrane protein [Alkalihalobacillus oceani]|uniref:YwaF family protein n=1 Tax=Halalkalibacter oceani TaxID=1653776 RepID=UPI00203C2F8F|nr:TIGR02206 family membrane protein [Halalkalibacter oceani]MCM3762113.1 TIGR02206 family membrane protein [Halalkalibacter oceani]